MKAWLAGGVVAGVVVLTWAMCPKGGSETTPEVEQLEAKEIVAYMASKEFGGLSEEGRKGFMEKLRDLPEEKRQEMFRAEEGVDEATRTALHENMRKAHEAMRDEMHDRMLEEARAFFELDAEAQTKALDERIDEMEARHKEMESKRPEGEAGKGPEGPGGPGGPGGPERKVDPEEMQKHMQGFISDVPAEERAIMSEYMRRMHERMEQRGISGPPGGPRG